MRIINRKAKADYLLLDKIEAGISLLGSEIKSLRTGQASLVDAHVRIINQEAHLLNLYIAPWKGSEKQIDVRRRRKLLLHKRQINNLIGKVAGSNLTIIPVSIYLKNNLAKVEIALARSKKKYERRQELKKKAIDRDVERELRSKE